MHFLLITGDSLLPLMQQHPGQVQGGHLDHLHHLDHPLEVGILRFWKQYDL